MVHLCPSPTGREAQQYWIDRLKRGALFRTGFPKSAAKPHHAPPWNTSCPGAQDGRYSSFTRVMANGMKWSILHLGLFWDRQDEMGAVKAMAAVAVLAAVLAGCAPADVAQPAAPSDQPGTANAQNMPPTAPAGVSAAIESVRASARKRGILPNNVWYEANNNAVMTIIPPSLDDDVQGFKADVAAISAAADGFTVGIRNALRSLEQAKAIQRRVDADTALLHSKGINITGTGITTNGDTVLVHVVGARDIDAVKRQLIDRYGAGIDAQPAVGSASY
jgi:hypothetical protein